MFSQERKNETRDLVVLLVQGEVAGVEQVDFGVRKIALDASAPGAMNEGSFRPQTTRTGGLWSRNHACHAG
jgi:hypothetical protein